MSRSKDHPFSMGQTFWRYILAHLDALLVSARILRQAPLATLLTATAIGVCLSLPFGVYLFAKNIQDMTAPWQSGSAITVYTQPKISPPQLDRIIKQANSFAFVKKITVIPPEKALQEFQAVSGLQDVLALLNENPLPGVISIVLDPSKASPEKLQQMKNTLEKMPKVNQVVFDNEWVEKLELFLALGKRFMQILYAIVGVGVLLVIGNTIRLSLERHREEVEVMRLMGATSAFIRRPFLYRGLLFGGLGGIIALLILIIAIRLLQAPTQELISIYQGLFTPKQLPFIDSLLILLISAALGWLGALIAFIQQRSALKYDSP